MAISSKTSELGFPEYFYFELFLDVSTISTLSFHESSWGEDEVQSMVGKLELNSYELHSTVTGGFRYKIIRVRNFQNRAMELNSYDLHL